MPLIKPPALRPGDTLAIVSLSSGASAAYPHRHDAGKRQLAQAFDVHVVDAPNARRDSAWLHANPRARADDLHWALTNDEVAGIVSSIGGDDSIRTVRFLDVDLIRSNPKPFLGFSDTTVQHLANLAAGVVTFYGPSLLAGFAENGGIHPYTEQSVREALFTASPFTLGAASEWTEEFLDWGNPALQDRRRRWWPHPGWTWLQGEVAVEGTLAGGCVEVLEMARGTSIWPPDASWDDVILLLETSEEAPPPVQVGRVLRNYAATGILARIGAILLARPQHYSQRDMFVLWDVVQGALAEAGRRDMPCVANVDYGHSSPMGVLPLGCRARVDAETRTITVLEAAVSDRG
jgi:muramoyltetrapeptide carboxypeptidase LdcA involved in peptidoglycan recycling